MSKDKKCTCKACKNNVFHCQICKFVVFLLPSSSWLLKLPIRELKQRPRRRQRLRLTSSENVTSRFCKNFAVTQSHYASKMYSNYSGIKLEPALLRYKTKINTCHHMLTTSRQLQNRSFHIIQRTRTSATCEEMKNARAKRAKLLFFVVKYANL